MSGLGEERQAPTSASGATDLPDLEFTGERLVPGKTVEPLFREHEERYIFAGRYVEGKDVLDVASGSGVGSAYLRDAGARSVRGFDIDPQAVAFAAARYSGCSFAVCSATDLALPEDSVDAVISFETIEHLHDQPKFIAECKRVLKPGGMFICSTPNARLSRLRNANEFHVHEMPLAEFQALIAASFGQCEFFSQSERVYPVFLAKRVVANTLRAAGLLGAVSRQLEKRPTGPLRDHFGGDPTARSSIVPARSNALFQPMFVIAVARAPRK
jgi:2-polyprenyl-3-methyl-5-hydroxy-6-metoxy-1,4-benzoquinol methylase